ncbi:MAG: photosynthetic reaction center cytochrome PufC [Pseudomonadota bacterium]
MRIVLTLGVVAVTILLVIAMLTTAGWDRPPIASEQHGYDGTGQVLVWNPRTRAASADLHEVPQSFFPFDEFKELPYYPDNLPADALLASDFYENVQVLGHLTVDQFNRLMTSMTTWVAPEENGYDGCAYCHNLDNLADDSLYTYQVARRMFQMTWDVNMNWQDHVGATGVTCYTCHRGHPVPQNIWFTEPPDRSAGGFLGDRNQQNRPSPTAGMSSLPHDPYTAFFLEAEPIRVGGTQALPYGNESTWQQTEWTYSLMMHMSTSLGTNCTLCHNTNNFSSWENAPPQRYNAWYGIRMVRDLNNDYLVPLQPVYPEMRLGHLGDAPKANCATCHYGAQQPFYGTPMLDGYPSLRSAPVNPGQTASLE